MPTAILRVFPGLIRPFSLAGPIFTKELRVTSRRRRHYLLRLAYLALLGLLVVIVWLSTVESHSPGPSIIYKMPEAGKTLIAAIAWFQFLALQLVAVIATSTAISDEIYHGTIAALMTTPLTCLQIVLGKVLSKMLQLVSLVLVGLPLLGIIRLFGGVPWGYLVSSTCITLTAGLFAAAVSMFYSVLFRRAYATILLSLGTLFFLFGILTVVIAMVLMLVAAITRTLAVAEMIAMCLNPFWAMGLDTAAMTNPGLRVPYFAWPLHCLVMIVLSAGVLALCVKLVRKVALRKAMGGRPVPPPAAPPPVLPVAQAGGTQKVTSEIYGPVRSVGGSPLLWKELRTPLLRNRTLRIVAIVLALVIAAMVYVPAACLGGMTIDVVHGIFATVYVLIGIACVAVLSATSISSEKESRSLPLLLTTPLSDRYIIAAKAAGVLRRCLPVWLFLAGHLLLFTLLGILHPIALLHLLTLVAWLTAFLTATGLYFSARFKKTTSAVIANLALAATLWLFLPAVLSTARAGFSHDIVPCWQCANPLSQAQTLGTGARWFNSKDFTIFGSGSPPSLKYHWAVGELGPGQTTLLMLVIAAIYWAIALVFLWRAKHRLRRDIF